jgi:hypothetical protein
MSQLSRISGKVAMVAASAALAGPVAGASAADFPLKAYWPMAEGKGQTVKDWSLQGHNGTLGSTPGVDSHDPTWIKGVFSGSALRFGGDDFVDVPDSPGLRPQNLTVSMWVRAPQSPGAFSYLLSRGSQGCVAGSYAIETGWSGGIVFNVWDGANVHWSASLAPSKIWDGRWHHVAGTYDGVLSRLYVDGQEIPGGSSFPGNIDYSGPAGASTIGSYRGTCDLYFTGDIDEVRVFSSALPVADLWKKISSLFGTPTPR